MKSTGEPIPLPKIALAGHPNVGKTTLFNQLTGEQRKVGNYAGVTVERSSATFFTPHGHEVELIDLPGAYSLSPNSPDEQVTRDVLLGDFAGESRPDLVICVVDATSLERHLYLVLQVMDAGLPVVVALNQVDRADSNGLRINRQVLADILGIPVVPTQATSGQGILQLKQTLRFPIPPPAERIWKGKGPLESALHALTKKLAAEHTILPEAHAIHLLADPDYRLEAQPHLSQEAQQAARESAAELVQRGLNPEDAISEARNQAVRRALRAAVIERDHDDETGTDRIDRWTLHPVSGWAILASLMFVVFYAIFKLASYPMDWIEAGVGFCGQWVGGLLPEGDLRDLLVDGIIGGVGSVVVFLPQIVLLFLLIGLLEGSGYMARAAFLMDKVMARAGLTGKSFLPLLSGYACAIPGVMATRTIGSPKERLLTILILPWMSCTARLPVYFLLVPLLVGGAFMQTTMMFVLYALGTGTALLAAWLLSKRIGRAEAPPQFLMELPPYRWPDLAYVGRQVLARGLAFLKKAGTIIMGLSILLWALGTFPKAPKGDEDALSYSIMGRLGAVIAPVVAPLGWDGRLGTAMLTSFAAREVFVSSMAISFAIDEEDQEEEVVRDQIRGAVQSATKADGSPLYGPLTVLSLLVFYVYALQCLPTTVVVQRETRSWKWALGQLAGMTLFAYCAALLVFQLGRTFGLG